MSKKRSTTGTIASSLVVGVVIGAVATLGYQAYQTTGDDVQELTNDNESAYGVGGGDVIADFDETGDVPGLDDETEDGEEGQSENKKDAGEKDAGKTNEEKEADGEGTEENSAGSQQGKGFTFPALTRPIVETQNAESTVYEYGGDNAISVLSGKTADAARASAEFGVQEEILVDGVEATLVTTTSLKNGSTEQVILIERDDELLFVRGDESFILQVQSDLDF